MKNIRFVYGLTLILLISFTTVSSASSYVMHTIKSGDTYWNISQRYNSEVNTLLKVNNTTSTQLHPGNLVKIKALDTITIFVDDKKIIPDQNPYLENNRTFVPIRFVAEALNTTVSWDGMNQSAIIDNGDVKITLPIGSNEAYVNGKSYKLDAPVQLFGNRTFVPLRFISEVLGCSVDWVSSTFSVKINTSGDGTITPSVPATSTYSEEDLYWLSRLIHAEAEGEPYEGKLAVANVIINRKNVSEFPNTIKGVIFDAKYAIQFTPVKNGKIYNTPNTDSINAAKQALEGTNNISRSLYFVNPMKSPNSWIARNRLYNKSIANHAFYY